VTLRRREAQGKGKLAAPQPAQDTNPQTPLFCLAYLAPTHRVSNCEQAERAAFACKLEEMCRLTWAELTLAPRHGAGCEKIRRSELRVAVPAAVTEDVDHFLAFRFDGMKAVVGFRHGRVFHVVWLDRAFNVYQH
jgi:hypothetical protein